MDITLEAKIKNKFAVESNEAFIFDINFNKNKGGNSVSAGGSIPVRHKHHWNDLSETPNHYPPTKHFHSMNEVDSLPDTINVLAGEIAGINQQLIGFQAGTVLIGTIDKSTVQITNILLHDRAKEIRADVKNGYVIVDNDGIKWWCEEVASDGESSQWNNIGQSIVGNATNETAGSVKGSLDDNKVSVEVDGTMKVNNLDAEKVNLLSEYLDEKIGKVATVGLNLLSHSGGEALSLTDWVATSGQTGVVDVLPGEALFGKICFRMSITDAVSYATLEQVVPIIDVDRAYTLSFWYRNNITVTGQTSAYIVEYDAYMVQTSISKLHESSSILDGWENAEVVHNIKHRATKFLGVHFKFSKAGVGYEQSLGYLTDIILSLGDKDVWHPIKDKYVLRTGGSFIGKIFAPAYGRFSDRVLKENILPIPYETLELVRNITPVEYNVIGDNRLSYGFIAQEVETYFPSLVSKNDDGYKTLDYDQIQNIQIAYLMAKITKLEAEINN